MSMLFHIVGGNFKKILPGLKALNCTVTLQDAWIRRLAHFAPRFMGLPPQWCPSTCDSALDRQKVAFVRNPFKRVTSMFSNWLEDHAGESPPPRSSLDDHCLGSWADFERWLGMLRSWMTRVQEEASGYHDSPDFERDWDIWQHLRPMVDVILGQDVCVTKQERWNIEEY